MYFLCGKKVNHVGVFADEVIIASLQAAGNKPMPMPKPWPYSQSQSIPTTTGIT